MKNKTKNITKISFMVHEKNVHAFFKLNNIGPSDSPSQYKSVIFLLYLQNKA